MGYEHEAALEHAQGHTSRVNAVVFSPDGYTLASAGADYSVKLWNVNTMQELSTLKGHAEYIPAIAFSPDGKTLASVGNRRTVKRWDVTRPGRNCGTLKGHVKGKSLPWPFRRTGTCWPPWHNEVKLWNVATKQEMSSLKGSAVFVTKVAFWPDRKTLATGHAEGYVKLWDVATKQELSTFKGHRATLTAVAF